ncbi:MAG: universal stress protein [Marinibacterium sp.]
MYKHILVPLAFDEEHDHQGALLTARALADDDAEFTLIHVMDPIPTYIATQIPAETMAKSRDDAQHQLSVAAKALPGAKTALVAGHAGREIVDYANEHGVDCIVMASRRPGLGHFFLGSTADWVVRHARCSVHVIR